MNSIGKCYTARGVIVSGLRPYLMLIDSQKKRLLLSELTVAWEEGIEEAHFR